MTGISLFISLKLKSETLSCLESIPTLGIARCPKACLLSGQHAHRVQPSILESGKAAISIQVWSVFALREVALVFVFVLIAIHIMPWICCQAIVVTCEYDVELLNDSAFSFTFLFFSSPHPTTTVPQEQQSDAVCQHH